MEYLLHILVITGIYIILTLSVRGCPRLAA